MVTIVLVVMVGVGIAASVYAILKKEAVHRGKDISVSQSVGLTFNDSELLGPKVPLVDINVYVLSVAPEMQTAKIRLVFGYWQANSNKDSPYTPEKVTVTVLGAATNSGDSSNTTANSFTFEQGQLMRPVDVEMNFLDNTALKYPFDRYTGYLVFNVSDSHGSVVQSSVTTSRNLADGWTTSPDSKLCSITTSSWYPFLQGFGPDTPDCTSGVDALPPASSGLQGFRLVIGREFVPQLYAIFIMALLWTLALSGVVVVLTVLRNKDEHDFMLPTYLAALLFAFPLIRGLLPGNPALGVLADFTSYFWVEAVIGVSLLVLVISWIRRSRHHLEEAFEETTAKRE